ncbi:MULTISPECIES: hypothetical protein [unclassified Bradyrhizobium]|uniref:hypothetical protein n=1 Tax=unclassified Bradyrhizobium TaxID=2631580 RepID=UPI001FF21F12|nr:MULTISPECIES: hypothetical protein [unclassified Bradyrhizobium]MCJ9703010.1 hypothetical protein [Bradyrhizobium sp. SHOUNA76]MCJ9732354.1 hypothetical protein [Bradyrhizobium sp. PRIMUS42]
MSAAGREDAVVEIAQDVGNLAAKAFVILDDEIGLGCLALGELLRRHFLMSAAPEKRGKYILIVVPCSTSL